MEKKGLVTYHSVVYLKKLNECIAEQEALYNEFELVGNPQNAEFNEDRAKAIQARIPLLQKRHDVLMTIILREEHDYSAHPAGQDWAAYKAIEEAYDEEYEKAHPGEEDDITTEEERSR
jgi:hypothetical protein